MHLRADDVGVRRLGRDHLRVCRALHRVVQAPVEVERQRRREDALGRVRRLELLEVGHVGERPQHVGLARRLRLDEARRCCYQRLAVALGGSRGREYARGERGKREDALLHVDVARCFTLYSVLSSVNLEV